MSRETPSVIVILNNTRVGATDVVFARRSARKRLAVKAGETLRTTLTKSDFQVYQNALLEKIQEEDLGNLVLPGGYIDLNTGEAYLTGDVVLDDDLGFGTDSRPMKSVYVLGDLTRTEGANVYVERLSVAGDIILQGTGDFVVDDLHTTGDLNVQAGTLSDNIVKNALVEGDLALGASAGMRGYDIRVLGALTAAAASAASSFSGLTVEGATTVNATAGAITMLNATLVGAVTDTGTNITHTVVTYPV